jgi:RsiW-degrading membrane proteinase PrsW (M82 family)
MNDPVEERADESRDLYDIASWEPRTGLDRLAINTYRGALKAGRASLVALGLLVLVLILGGGAGALIIDNPFILGLIGLSVIPAGLLALYVYRTDITTDEPATLLAATFVLSILFAGFAAFVNTALGFIQLLPLVGFVLFYFLVVGPIEETVKLLAVRLYAFRDDRFDSVIDGAVYGAVAGLGFATIENALYITRNLDMGGGEVAALVGPETAALGVGTLGLGAGLAQLGGVGQVVGSGGQITALRALAGPGHVIYSAFAGYYLGLAKFNPDRAGPIVVKGLLIAAFIHGTYNSVVGIVAGLASFFLGIPALVAFFGFVVVYDGVFGYFLYRKLKRYRAAYEEAHADEVDERNVSPELAEFDA